ncbi:MAG: hypothetical protein HY514_03530 [Candidatus Aenigmarchaeota archaeon]|nr:hypothetical protein [Candidatus Aenigmarchaeota archaeon]
MSSSVDEYIEKVIKQGDDGSELLAGLCAPTLKNSEHVDVIFNGMSGLAVLRIPDNYNVVAHTSLGDPDKLDAVEHTASLMDNLYRDAEVINSKPLALIDVIDASVGRKETVRKIGETLVDRANENRVAIINGELAILGNRVKYEANVSGTLIGLVPKSLLPGVYERKDARFVVFDPQGKAVHGNSDGVGTKTEFYERAGWFERALYDSLAMKLDDSSKNGARARAVFDTIERSGEVYPEILDREASRLGKKMGFEYVLVYRDAGSRLQGWREGAPVFNVGGSAITVIDEEYLKNPLIPREGDYVVAIRGWPNPRSNGITDKRRTMIRIFGNNWHETREGRMFLEFLAEPSTVFYPVFNELIDSKIATSVTHMSGGALEGKFAKPLAKQGLYAALERIYEADWRELAIAGFSFTPAEAAYAKWPMGNEGYITTKKPDEAIAIIEKYKLYAKTVGQLEKAKNGRTGVELIGIKGSKGENVYFSGR